MKRWKLLVAAVACVAGGLFVSQAGATGYFAASDNEKVRIAQDQTVDGSAYIYGQSVLIEGYVKGDLYCAGTNVIISGTIEGDVLCAGSDVTIGGTVKGDVRAAGSNVTIKGIVEGSASIAANNVLITSESDIHRDLTGGASVATLDGRIGRDMLIGTETLVLNGAVGRDVTGSMQQATFGDKAIVGGNFTYSNDKELSIPSNVLTAGKVTYEYKADDNSSFNSITASIWAIVVFAVFTLVITLVMPKFVHEAAMVPGRTVLVAFLAGIATFILLPIVAIIAMSTVVGVLVGVVLLVAWLLLLILSGVFSAYYVGTLVLKHRAKNALLVTLVGAAIVSAATMIPVVGVIVVIASACVGIGMQILQFRHQFSKHPYQIS